MSREDEDSRWLSENFPEGDAGKAADPFDAACAALSATDCPKSWRPVTRKTFARLAAWKQRKIVAAPQAEAPTRLPPASGA